jgi:hypothetical protein
MNIETKLTDMMQENTGRSILDSGGAYGRNWERNQGVDFAKRPEGSLEFYVRGDDVDIMPTLDVFHFLRDRLEYNEELDDRWRAWCEENDADLTYGNGEAFAEYIDGKGIYQEGPPFTINTYNGEDMLSQTLQYVYWTDEDGAHILLQIHGGCDVRGGYTDPVAFDLTCMEGLSIFDNARAAIYCSDCDSAWDSDGSNYWNHNGMGENLESFPATETKPDYPEQRDPAQRSLPIDLPKRPTPCADALWVDEDGKGHCPYCGGVLEVAPWPAG